MRGGSSKRGERERDDHSIDHPAVFFVCGGGGLHASVSSSVSSVPVLPCNNRPYFVTEVAFKVERQRRTPLKESRRGRPAIGSVAAKKGGGEGKTVGRDRASKWVCWLAGSLARWRGGENANPVMSAGHESAEERKWKRGGNERMNELEGRRAKLGERHFVFCCDLDSLMAL